MKVYKSSIANGSCNFCQRGVIDSTCTKLEYPYSMVTNVETDSSGISVRFCDDCLAELIKQGAMIL